MTKEAPCHGNLKTSGKATSTCSLYKLYMQPPARLCFQGQTGNIWDRLPGNRKFSKSSSGQTEHVTDPPELPCPCLCSNYDPWQPNIFIAMPESIPGIGSWASQLLFSLFSWIIQMSNRALLGSFLVPASVNWEQIIESYPCLDRQNIHKHVHIHVLVVTLLHAPATNRPLPSLTKRPMPADTAENPKMVKRTALQKQCTSISGLSILLSCLSSAIQNNQVLKAPVWVLLNENGLLLVL